MSDFLSGNGIRVPVVITVLAAMMLGCGASPAANTPTANRPAIDESALIAKAKTWTGSDWLDAADAEKSEIAVLWNEKVRSEYGRDLGAVRWSDSLTTFYLCGNIEDDPSTDCRGGKQGSAYLGMTVHMALESVCAVDLEICPDDYYDENSW